MSQSSTILDYARTSAFDLKSETSTEGDDAEFSQEILCSPHALPFRSGCSKAKSSLCKNFMEKGSCPYGGKCQFAHGPLELRINMEHNRSYKTKGCHAFAKKGFCCFGSRCNFIHEQTADRASDGKWEAIYANHRQTFLSMRQAHSSRLIALLQGPI
jgi:hypothetical protein